MGRRRSQRASVALSAALRVIAPLRSHRHFYDPPRRPQMKRHALEMLDRDGKRWLLREEPSNYLLAWKPHAGAVRSAGGQQQVLNLRLVVLIDDPIEVGLRAAIRHLLRQVQLDLEAEAGREADTLSRPEHGVRHETGRFVGRLARLDHRRQNLGEAALGNLLDQSGDRGVVDLAAGDRVKQRLDDRVVPSLRR